MRAPSDAEQDRIRRYLALDADELYALIPQYLPEYQETLFAPTGQVQAGRTFFDSLVVRLRGPVCEDFGWPARRNDALYSDTTQLVAAIADIIATFTVGVPPFVIATLIVKIGLDRICDLRTASDAARSQ